MKVNSFSGCNYYKIGKLVYIEGAINCCAVSATGQHYIGGLPYTASGQSTISVNYSTLYTLGKDFTNYDFATAPATKTLVAVAWALGRSWINDSCLSTTAGSIIISGVYYTS